MRYYEVLPAHLSYHGEESLTYHSENSLTAGNLVRITIRGKKVLGIVVKESAKPSFKTVSLEPTADTQPIPQAALELLVWLREYYPAPLGAIVRLFVPPTFSEKRGVIDEEKTSELQQIETVTLPDLSPAQTHALKTITGAGSFLLHGITGSGKSRVYLELAKRAAAANTSAIILTPEIGLTAQLAATFTPVFGEQVFVLHSQQTTAQRRDSWHAINTATKPSVIIGPRSALFSPVHNLGLIILDEAHDGAYKNESAPHYLASRVAAKLAALSGATYVSGSATPNIEDYYVAQAKNRPVVPMEELAKQVTRDVQIQTIDMRDKNNFSRSSILSDALLGYMESALSHGEQSLLFLNRRGTANVVLCNNCGWQALCPNCDLTLSYHGDEHKLRCHTCGYVVPLPTSCPECANTDIILKSIGTKAVVSEVQKKFPHATVQRFDTDLKKSERIEQNLYSISKGSADILIGTQIIGKGLDLPKLSVVGILHADSSLLLPDFTANERTYQLVSQVAGRVGRGHRKGTVIAQTYDPGNAVINSALTNDWDAFYKSELAERKQYHFPPFSYLLKLRCLRASSKASEAATQELARILQSQYPGLIVEGPSPSFHPRERGKYSWHILLKSPQRSVLTDIISKLPSGWLYDIDPINLL